MSENPLPKRKPCPFCAHETIRTVENRTRSGNYVYSYSCLCEACGAMGPTAKEPRLAIGNWNARLSQADLFAPPGDILQNARKGKP